jgi:hypothetical protein
MRNSSGLFAACAVLGILGFGQALAEGVPVGPGQGVINGGNSNQSANTQQRKKAKADTAQKDNPKDPKNDPEYKEKLADNLAAVKELLDTAEAKFKEQNYREAAGFYKSVTLATVPKSEPLVEQARKQLIAMEELAQQHLNAANDADLARDYIKEVEELGIVLREFAFTKAVEQATTRLAALKPRKEVAGLIELAQAGAAEAAGNLAQAYKMYKAIAENPRYENTLAALKGKKAAERLQNEEATRENLKTQLKAEADKEAPPLLNSGRNFLLNHQEEQAKEKFQLVVEKYPGTDYAEEAKKELAKLR